MKYLCTIVTLFLPIYLNAQEINGVVKDETNNQPLEGSFITLLSCPQKELIASTYTEADGKFSIQGLSNDSTFLLVRTLGYKDSLIALPPLHEDISLGEIRIPLNTDIVLDEVVVKAKPYVLRKDVDRIVMSLPKISQLTKNNTIWGMLRYTPMLKVDEVQGLGMLGKQNLVVYINGRKSSMSGTEIQNYLKSVPADNIKTIELITNPGSKFNVDAQTGIVNITLRRNEGEGVKGFVSAQMWQTHYNKQIASLNLNYVKRNIDLKTTFSARNLADWNKSESEVLFPKTGAMTERNSTYENRRQLYSGNLDFSFRPTEKQVLGMVVDFSLWDGNPKNRTVSRYTYQNAQTVPDSLLSSQLDTHTKTNRAAINLNYTFNFNSNNKLALDVDYQYYKTNQNEVYSSTLLEDDAKDIPQTGYVQHLPQSNHLWMGQLEYTALLHSNHKIIAGADGYISDSRNENSYSHLYNLTEQEYPGSRFDYQEKELSGYLSYESNWGEKLSSAVGARAKYTHTRGELVKPERQVSSHHYWKVLPSLSLTFIPSERHYLWYSLATQHTYPMYEYLNPFKNYQSPTVCSTGNVDLKPSYTVFQELGYYLNSQYMFSLSQYATHDAVDVLTVADGNMEITSPVNYGKETGWRLTANINQAFFQNRWFLNMTFMGQYAHYQGHYADINIDKDGFYGELNMDNTIVLSEKYSWNLLCNFQFRTSEKRLMTKTESDMRGSIEIRKNIKKWAFSASYYRSWNYNGNNYSSIRKRTYLTSDMESSTFSQGEYQGVMLRVSYNFGNKKVKSGKKHQMIISNQKDRYSGNK